MSSPKDFSFCESVHAGPRSPCHILRLTEEGRKLGGGIDTSSLCGRVKVGWDLNIPLNQLHLEGICDLCREVILEEIPLTSFPPNNYRRNRQD